jgi:hypothetical protein
VSSKQSFVISRFSSHLTAAFLLSAVLAAQAMAQQNVPGGGTPPPAGAGGPPPMGGFSSTVNFTPGIYVKDGVYLPDKSIPSTVTGKNLGNKSASGISITSKQDDFNGIYVKGNKSIYTLADSEITLYGNGSNDFTGIGSGIMADGGATVILKNVKITTNGVISPAAVSANGSTLRVYDSVFKIHGGTLPKGYVAKIGPGMMEPPAPLGITGTARGVLTLGDSKSYYYNTTLIADGWGALSTDMAGNSVYVEANNCDIETVKSGYGTYADGMTHVVINDSKIRSATYVAILAGSGELKLTNSDAVAVANGFMIHNVVDATQAAGLSIVGGKTVSDGPVILVKSANATIDIANSELESKSGILMRSIVNTDANTAKTTASVQGIRATFKDMNLKGNILHEDLSRSMSLTLKNTTLKGAVHGAEISLDESSKWTATENSDVTLVGKMEIARIDAGAGVKISAKAGMSSNLKGHYQLASGGRLDVETN